MAAHTVAELVGLLPIRLSLCLPWFKQWYADIDSVYHQRLGDFHDTFLNSQLPETG